MVLTPSFSINISPDTMTYLSNHVVERLYGHISKPNSNLHPFLNWYT